MAYLRPLESFRVAESIAFCRTKCAICKPAENDSNLNGFLRFILGTFLLLCLF